jgi:putative tricarboxylic transport membrane protein
MIMDLANILTFSNILFSAIGVIVGIVFGALPGLTATMGFGMDVASAMAMLLGIYVAGIYGGSISAVLIKTPGTPSSAATVLDGYPLAMKGKAQEALSLITIASFLGGIFSAIMLIVVAPQLAKIALDFGPPEYFAVALFGLAMVANLSTQNFLKGILAALFGILMSTIGIDGLSGTMRFTFGNINMAAGMELISTLIGLFALSEVFEKLESTAQMGILGDIKKITGGKVISLEILKILKQNIFNIIRSGIIGTIVGIVPATGTSIGSWFSYNEAKRASKHPEKFGGSHLRVYLRLKQAISITGGALVPF